VQGTSTCVSITCIYCMAPQPLISSDVPLLSSLLHFCPFLVHVLWTFVL
jgi:hypothetical protein